MAPPAPTVRTVLLQWTLDPAFALVVLAAAGSYVVGVRRLARRHRPWPPSRTAAFLAGLAAVAFATQSGLARYDTVLFSLHTLQHVVLGMVAPFLLALGAPITLALQAAHRPTQRALLRLVHSRLVATLTHPVVAWTLFGGTLFALYLSPLFEWSLRNDLVHVSVHLHFLLVGSLFFWPAVGLDPMRRRLTHPARLLYVLLAVPFHAFLGLAVMSMSRPLGGTVYGSVGRRWGPSLLADQHSGASLLWAVGDLFGLVAGAVVVAQWVRYDERRQLREDRRLDAALRLQESDSARPP
jgi:putative copper resistance protein D